GDGGGLVGGAPGNGGRTGAAVVFTGGGSSWTVGQVLGSGEFGDLFGSAVAIGHGWVVVGAPGGDVAIAPESVVSDAGLVYVFQEQTGGGWALFQPLHSSNPFTSGLFGGSVAIDDTANVIVIGAPGELGGGEEPAGAAYVYELVDGQWVAQTVLAGTEDGGQFGSGVDVDSGTVVVGAPGITSGQGRGGAFVYDLNGNLIQQLPGQTGTGGVGIGGAVAIDGNMILVGGGAGDQGNNGKVDGYERQTGGGVSNGGTQAGEGDPWTKVWTLGGDTSFGRSLSISGGLFTIGAP